MLNDKLVAAKLAWEMLGIKKTYFYELAKCEGFPSRYKIGKRAVRWIERELIDWRNRQKVS